MLTGGLNPPLVWTDADHPPGVTLELLERCHEAAKYLHFGTGWYRVVRVVTHSSTLDDRKRWRCELVVVHPAKSRP